MQKDEITNFHRNCQNVILNSTLGDWFLLLGDLNTPDIVWTKTAESNALIPENPSGYRAELLIETLNTCNLNQFNAIPNKNNRYLDLVLSTLPTTSIAVSEDEILCCVDGHHLAYQINILNIHSEAPIKHKYKKRYNFNKCNYENVRSEFDSTEWADVLSLTNVNECVDAFYDRVNEVISRHAQLVRNRPQKYPSWYSAALVRCIKEKNKIHKRFKKYSNPRDYDTFSLLSARCKFLTAECHRKHLATVEKSLGDGPKSFC